MPDHPIGPQVPACDRTHAEKHRLPGESFRESSNRVAAALKDNDEHFSRFRSILLDMRFAPGGRVKAAMGDGTGAVMLDGKMEDDASLKQCLVMVTLAEQLGQIDPELGEKYAAAKASAESA